MPLPTTQQKQAAAVLANIAEALEEVAFQEAGESDDLAVLDACSYLLRLAGRISEISLLKRHGQTCYPKVNSPEIPF